MMDPTSYLLISNSLNSDGTINGLANNINSILSDFEQSTSDASSGSPSHYGDPFVGGLSYFDQPTTSAVTAATTTTPNTTPSRAPPALSPADLAAAGAASTNSLNNYQHHNHHHHLHHHHNHQHHLSHNQLHHHSSLPTTSSASSLMLNINNFSLDQLVDHNVLDDDLDQHQHHHHLHHNNSSMPYLDHTQLDHTDLSSSLMIGHGCDELDDDDDLIHGTLTSFVCTDLGSESDNGYTSGVSDGLFTSSSSLVDCSDSQAADPYCFKQFSFSDLHGLIDVGCNSTPKQMAGSTEKRSVLMNLLIYGSDIGAGYTSIKR